MLLVVSDKLGGLKGDLLEDVIDERVHNAHGFLGDSSVGVDLLEDSVDIDGESFGSLSLLFLVGGDSLFGSLFLGSGGGFGGSGSWHIEVL